MKTLFRFLFCIIFVFCNGCIFSYDNTKQVIIVGNYCISSSGAYNSLIYRSVNSIGGNVVLMNVDSVGWNKGYILGVDSGKYFFIDTLSHRIIKEYNSRDEFISETKNIFYDFNLKSVKTMMGE